MPSVAKFTPATPSIHATVQTEPHSCVLQSISESFCIGFPLHGIDEPSTHHLLEDLWKEHPWIIQQQPNAFTHSIHNAHCTQHHWSILQPTSWGVLHTYPPGIYAHTVLDHSTHREPWSLCTPLLCTRHPSSLAILHTHSRSIFQRSSLVILHTQPWSTVCRIFEALGTQNPISQWTQHPSQIFTYDPGV